MENGREAFTDDVLEARNLKRLCEYILGPKLKKKRTHLRVYPHLDNRKNLCPATAVALPPDNRHGSATGLQHPGHFLQRTHRMRHIHEPESAQGDVERAVGQPYVLG